MCSANPWNEQKNAFIDRGYNLAIIPALLFSIRHIRTRGEAIGAGLLAGPIAMIPAFLFFVAMLHKRRRPISHQ